MGYSDLCTQTNKSGGADLTPAVWDYYSNHLNIISNTTTLSVRRSWLTYWFY